MVRSSDQDLSRLTSRPSLPYTAVSLIVSNAALWWSIVDRAYDVGFAGVTIRAPASGAGNFFRA